MRRFNHNRSNRRPAGKTWPEILVIFTIIFFAVLLVFIGTFTWFLKEDRLQAALAIRNAQQGNRSACGLAGFAVSPQGGKPLSYLREYLALNGTAPPQPLREKIFGPGRYLETPLPGQLPLHPFPGARYHSPFGDWDTVPPLGELYMESTDLPAFIRPDFFSPPGLQ